MIFNQVEIMHSNTKMVITRKFQRFLQLCILTEESRNFSLTFELTHLTHSTFRILIDEYEHGKINPDETSKRFRLPSGESLKAEPKVSDISITIGDRTITLLAGTGESAIISTSPFSIDFFLKDQKLATFNHDQIMNFEDAVRFPPKKEPSPVNTVEKTEPIETSNNDQSTDTDDDDDSESSEDNKIEEPESEQPIDPNPWRENFKTHTDTRPKGPSSISADFGFPGFTNLYGIPEHTDSLRLAETIGGEPYRLYNLDVFDYDLDSRMALYGSVPFTFAHSTNNSVGVFWHNPSETWVDIRYSEKSSGMFANIFSKKSDFAHSRWISESGVIDCFIMLHESPKALSSAFAALTGTTPLPPLFALSYHQCRWNYNDMDDILNVSASFDQHVLPMDVLWLDIEHTDDKRYFTWDATKFPDPGKMVDTLKEVGRKLVTVVDPHIKRDNNWDIYKTASENNYFIRSRDGEVFDGWCWPGSSSWPDFLNPVVQRWWAELFLTYEPVRDDTLFTWNDMGEPSIFNGPEVTLHKDALHFGDVEHRDMHNHYGALVHRSTFDGLLLKAPSERPFVLTRAFFAGSQRTAAVWTGDNKADWGHLRASIPMLNSLSISGIPFCGADVGGFFDNPEPELLVRWYQAAAFQPFFRAHAHLNTKRREPYLFPEKIINTIRQAIRTRYTLLPYWYTQFAFSEATGEPVMAPLWYHFPKDTATFELDSQHMVGDAILVAPVMSPGDGTVKVYFPQGVWYHHTSYEEFAGPQTQHIPVTLDTVPAFYRGGRIIFKRERPRRSSWAMRNDEYTLDVCIDPELDQSTGFVYTDDLHSTLRTGAVLYEAIYQSGGARGDAKLRLERRPLPGEQTIDSSRAATANECEIERIRVIGHRSLISRASILDKSTNSRRQLVHFNTTQLSSGSYVTVFRQPSVQVNQDWELHVVMNDRLTDDL